MHMKLPQEFQRGQTVFVKVKPNPTAKSCSVNLTPGPISDWTKTGMVPVPLHLVVRFAEGIIVANTFMNKTWATEHVEKTYTTLDASQAIIFTVTDLGGQYQIGINFEQYFYYTKRDQTAIRYIHVEPNSVKADVAIVDCVAHIHMP